MLVEPEPWTLQRSDNDNDDNDDKYGPNDDNDYDIHTCDEYEWHCSIR